MTTLEIKKELHDLIDKGDASTIKGFYEMLKSYIVSAKNDKMIADAEKDIKSGDVLTHEQVKNIVAAWRNE
ncbi:hypothetical protein KJK34_02380 [Flavobacterium sp. D11R37]|uniref:hypothetical protein n=1 Tax=Flavobacterium coralii TaxID=2838017 RepID=UPI001CA7A0F0|nr:hypothetical protein [Flavobacterium coralii]MBY8961591.1 hypothetical protein [Flavobacterium coralii]